MLPKLPNLLPGMIQRLKETGSERLLGIEGGGTRTVAILSDDRGRLLRRVEAGPGNARLLTDRQMLSLFEKIRAQVEPPTRVAIGLAGARDAGDWMRIRNLAERVWRAAVCHATHDLDTALAAAPPCPGGEPDARVLILSGTGSCCFGRRTNGDTARIGGWGHILGDKGSGFEIGLRALKAVVFYFDRDREWSLLGRNILRVLQLNEPNDLIAWVQNAGKDEVAGLAIQVFNARGRRDRIATDILTGAAESLARDAVACAGRLGRGVGKVQFIFAGGVLRGQPWFARQVARRIEHEWPGAVCSSLAREGAWGAIELARGLQASAPSRANSLSKEKVGTKARTAGIPGGSELSTTERRNPRSTKLDTMPLRQGIRLMLSEDARIPAAILRESAHLEKVIGWIVRAFKSGGRLFYVGAGTSGRLGILDASECPPTFRADPEMVQGIIAGGRTAIWQAAEGAEDDPDAGARAIQHRGVSPVDVVVGIAASGRTPFVWGAIREARRLGARTVLVCFNNALQYPRGQGPHLMIAPEIGPEVLTGSTRLKSGTATKLILNMFTTLAMTKIGKVVGNLMVDLNPSNIKLRDRAIRILRELTGADCDAARAALEKSGWVVKDAWKRLRGARLKAARARRNSR
jgi:N-acetylmuramic acid 6-phosphate etherase